MKMPVLFIGHGSPMNAIEENTFSESWKQIGKSLPRPTSILAISAHWATRGTTQISKDVEPEMIYDMHGFPSELYQVRYSAPGNPELAERVAGMIPRGQLVSRGMDHGMWSTLVHLFPGADIPVVSMSIDINSSLQDLMELGKQLRPLREEGVLILGNGNTVHNLMAIDWKNSYQYSWAREFDERVAKDINSRNYTDLLRFHEWGDITRLAHPTDEHLLPIFPLIGAITPQDIVTFFTPDITLGSLSMRSIMWREE